MTSLTSARAKLVYSNVRSSLGKVDDEKGEKATLVVAADYVDGTFVPGFYGTFDKGFALPAHHWSIWSRSAAGFSPTSADNPFANFYFGGFGNNWVDHGDEKRYREFSSFPGVPLNDIGGRNFVKSTIEWNLPPIRFRNVGTPGFYVAWVRPAVFVSGVATGLDSSDLRRTAASVGGQLDFQFSALATLDMTLSVGAGIAAEKHYGPRHEVMVSLKVLR